MTGNYQRTFGEHEHDFIHTAEHFFMERQLCELFANIMVTLWYVVVLLPSLTHPSSFNAHGHSIIGLLPPTVLE